MLDYYVDHDGDVTHILEHIICSTNEDVERFIKYLDTAVSSGVLDKTKKYALTRGKVQLLPDEKEEAKKEKKKIKQQ